MRSSFSGRIFLLLFLVLTLLVVASPAAQSQASGNASRAGLADRIRITPPPQAGLSVHTSTTRGIYSSGDRLSVGLSIHNPGVDAIVDFYFGVLLADGVSVLSFTGESLQISLGSLADLRTLRPYAEDQDLLTPFTVEQPEIFSYVWSGSEPAGTYAIFFLVAWTGALNDNILDPEEIVAADVTFFSFAP
jgi:hypothetical protein